MKKVTRVALAGLLAVGAAVGGTACPGEDGPGYNPAPTNADNLGSPASATPEEGAGGYNP